MARIAGEDARFLAGGQSLVPMMNFRIVSPTALVDLSGCSDLAYVRYGGDKLHIGAMTRQFDAEADPLVRRHCPLLAEALSHAGPATIRHRATVGGSIANGYPVAELPVVARCLDAEMIVASARGQRRIAAADFFVSGMVTALEPGELLSEIAFPVQGPEMRFAFTESGNHSGGSALAIVAANAEFAAGGQLSKLSLSAAGIASIPVRLANIEMALVKGGLDVSIAAAYQSDMAALRANAAEPSLVEALVEDAVTRLKGL